RYNLGNGIGGLVTFGSVITGNYNNGTVAFASTGAITSTNIGVLEVDVLNATAAGKVTISGSATFAAGAGIWIDVQAGVSLTAGQSFTILSAGTLTTDGSANPFLVNDGGAGGSTF